MQQVLTSRRRRRLLAVLMVGVAAVAAAGCGLPGSAAKPPAAAASASSTAVRASNSMLAFAQCVRQHGVPNFPDPTGGLMRMTVQNGKTLVNGVPMNVSSSTFQAAQRACRGLLSVATGTAAANPQLQQKALAFGQCMRTHGLPNFPDPKVIGNGIQVQFQGNMSSPAFQAAQKACQSILPVPGAKGS